MNIFNITRLSWNQFQCLVQYSVHKRITVFSEQGQGKNKQTFVVNKVFNWIDLKMFTQFITGIMNYKLQK